MALSFAAMSARAWLGCIADDFTGATDLANNLVRGGMRVVLSMGVPQDVPDADAIVIALKSRTAPVAEAVADCLAACRWLRTHGARQVYFKVCSTFDSTPRGNIGPVAEALMEELEAALCVVTPAFPEAGRRIFMGHLFVGEQLLSESPMRNHPLTPMTDSNLVRVMQAQLDPGKGRKTGLVPYSIVAQGARKIEQRLSELGAEGLNFAVVDALADADMVELARAVQGHRMMVAGSGLAIGLPAVYGLSPGAKAATLPQAQGTRAVISGSCSAASNAQVAAFLRAGGQAWAIDALRIGSGVDLVAEALQWAVPRLEADKPVLLYATAAPETVRQVQAALGSDHAGHVIEQTLAGIAQGLVRAGVGQLVIAGGETSGACIQALGIGSMRVGPQIDPGVPWSFAHSASGQPLHVALKSGNFGGIDFFFNAFNRLEESSRAL
jgi:3-dehydrotetronate 4-kinase